jgi:hypothetical protein
MTRRELPAGRVVVPVLFCPDCARQLVNHLFWVVGTETALVCVLCARRRPAGSVAALLAESAGFVRGAVPVLTPADAVALLVRLGARPVGVA